MKKIRINFEKFSDGILIPQFPWPYIVLVTASPENQGFEHKNEAE